MMEFSIKKIITETIIQETIILTDIIKNSASINYQDIEGEKSSTKGFQCKNLYIAKIDEENSGKLNFKKFL